MQIAIQTTFGLQSAQNQLTKNGADFQFSSPCNNHINLDPILGPLKSRAEYCTEGSEKCMCMHHFWQEFKSSILSSSSIVQKFLISSCFSFWSTIMFLVSEANTEPNRSVRNIELVPNPYIEWRLPDCSKCLLKYIL